MGSPETERSAEPRLLVEPAGCVPTATRGHWSAGWRLRNAGSRSVELLASWLPHGRFRADEQALEPPLVLAPGETVRLERTVACSEPPGTVVENAFLIVRLASGDRRWRLFARLEIRVDQSGAPEFSCEDVKVHPVGFSEISTEPTKGSS